MLDDDDYEDSEDYDLNKHTGSIQRLAPPAPVICSQPKQEPRRSNLVNDESSDDDRLDINLDDSDYYLSDPDNRTAASKRR